MQSGYSIFCNQSRSQNTLRLARDVDILSSFFRQQCLPVCHLNMTNTQPLWKGFHHLSSLLASFVARAQNTVRSGTNRFLDMLESSVATINYLATEAEFKLLLVGPFKILLLLKESKSWNCIKLSQINHQQYAPIPSVSFEINDVYITETTTVNKSRQQCRWEDAEFCTYLDERLSSFLSELHCSLPGGILFSCGRSAPLPTISAQRCAELL